MSDQGGLSPEELQAIVDAIAASQETRAPEPDFIGNYDLGFIAGRPATGVESNGFGRPSAAYAPAYIDNDNWAFTYGLSSQQITQIQADLVSAGFLDGDDIVEPGVWGGAEASVMGSVMNIANGSNRSWQQVVSGAIAAGGAGRRSGGGGGGRLPTTIRLSNADDLRSVFRQVAVQQHGGKFVEDDQIEQMVTAFQDREREFQLAAQRGGTVESSPSAQTFAETSLEESDPGAATANRFQQMAAVMNQIVGA